MLMFLRRELSETYSLVNSVFFDKSRAVMLLPLINNSFKLGKYSIPLRSDMDSLYKVNVSTFLTSSGEILPSLLSSKTKAQ